MIRRRELRKERHMLYEKMAQTQEARDSEAFLELVHDDFVMVSHQSGTQRDKAAFSEMLNHMMSSDKLVISNQRCVYENDDILVEHSFMTFPDGSKEAVMGVWSKKDGQFIKVETGATPVK